MGTGGGNPRPTWFWSLESHEAGEKGRRNKPPSRVLDGVANNSIFQVPPVLRPLSPLTIALALRYLQGSDRAYRLIFKYFVSSFFAVSSFFFQISSRRFDVSAA